MNKAIKKNTIERVKDVMLVVLVLSTILLLYFFWEDISLKDIRLENFVGQSEMELQAAFTSQEVILPTGIMVCFDTDVSTLVTEGKRDIWSGMKDSQGRVVENGFIQYFTGFCLSDNLLLEEIKEEEYQRVVSSRSMQIFFDYYISFKGFYDSLELKRLSGYDNIDAMTEMAYSQDRPENLFIYDGGSGKYFRLLSDLPQEGFARLIEKIETAGYNPYHSLGTVVLGEDGNNPTPIPLEMETNIHTFDYAQEFYPQDSTEGNEKITSIAKSFFGSGFDFVRRIEEGSGTVTYMYGYGEKVLIVGIDGTLEYKEEERGGAAQIPYFDALNRALQFAAFHGGFETLCGQELTPYLKEVEATSGKKGLRFTFGISIEDYEISYMDGDPLIVEVVGGQVTYFKRNFICFDAEQAFAKEAESFSVVNTLAQNYEAIYGILTKEGLMEPLLPKDDIFAAVMNQVSGVQHGYVRRTTEEDEEDDGDEENSKEEVNAAWQISLCGGAAQVYLDLQDETLLGYGMK